MYPCSYKYTSLKKIFKCYTFICIYIRPLDFLACLAFYCCYQSNSEHPLAKAIVEYAKKLREQYGSNTNQIAELKEFEVHPGAGVSANIGDKQVLVGNKKLMLSFKLLLSPEIENCMLETEQQARTCVLVAVEREICGAFAVSDPLKPDAGRVVSFLNSMGISSIMVTGDNWATATAIAREVGINTVFAETDPVGKAQKIKDLQVTCFCDA